MRSVTKIYFLDDEGNKFFGEGPCRLLHLVEETGSLRAAALSMGMAYTKALKLLNQAEAALGFPLTARSVGGKSGGGMTLTPQGKSWLQQYENYRDACVEANRRLYEGFFSARPLAHDRIGCVILASGLGNRFGGNKLLAEFRGKPLIQWVLDATGELFPHRVVVTRHAAIEALCRQQNIPCILHELPYRRDTIRLGVEHLQAQMGDALDGCLFCPSDQPLLQRETLTRLTEAFAETPDCIWRPEYEGVQGAPVLFPRWALPELTALQPHQGGSVVVKSHREAVRTVPAHSARELKDIDTKEDLKALER